MKVLKLHALVSDLIIKIITTSSLSTPFHFLIRRLINLLYYSLLCVYVSVAVITHLFYLLERIFKRENIQHSHYHYDHVEFKKREDI